MRHKRLSRRPVPSQTVPYPAFETHSQSSYTALRMQDYITQSSLSLGLSYRLARKNIKEKKRSGQIKKYALEPDAIPRSFTERVKILLQLRPLTLLFSIQPAIWIESHRIGVDFRVQKREMRIHAHRCARLDSPIFVTQCLIRRHADQARCGNSIDTQTFCDAGSLPSIKNRSLHH